MADEPISQEVVDDPKEAVEALPGSAVPAEKAPDAFTQLQALDKQSKEVFLAKDLARLQQIDVQMQKIYDDEVAAIQQNIDNINAAGGAQNGLDLWSNYQKTFTENAQEKLNALEDGMNILKEQQSKAQESKSSFTPETIDPQKAIDLIMKRISEVQKKLGEDAAYAMRAEEAKKISDAVKAKL